MKRDNYEIVSLSQLPIHEVADYEKFLEEIGMNSPKFIRFVDTVDDKRADKKFELVKLKPFFGVINESVIELFNAKTGVPEVTAESHNVLATRISKAAFFNWYYMRVKSVNAGNPGVSLLPNLFHTFCLTDWAGNEDANMLFVLGTPQACARASYSGAGVWGTYNSGESNPDNSQLGIVKAVYDWTTNQGNGIHKTLWFANCWWQNSYGYYHSRLEYVSRKSIGQTPASTQAICTDDVYIYTVTTGTDGMITKRDMNDVATIIATLTVLAGATFHNLCWDGGEYLYAHVYASTAPYYRIYKIRLSDFSVVGYVTGSSNFGAYGASTYFNGYLYFTNGTDIYKVDPSTGAIVTTKTATELGGLSRIQYLDSDGVRLFIGDGSQYGYGSMFGFDDSWNKVIMGKDGPTSGVDLNQLDSYGSTWRAKLIRSGNLAGQFISTSTNNYNVSRISFIDATSQTKLASQIEKTAANTMKATFQFNVTMPY